MSDLSNDLERIDRDIRINEMEEQLNELGAHEMQVSPDCPPEMHEGFLRSVLDYENAADTTHLEQLARRGYRPPAPAELDDEHLATCLWELIGKLAEIRVFLSSTNHLSDRELYVWLYHESLRDVVKDLPADEHSACHLDVLGACSAEDMHLSLRYYEDEESRQHWHKDFPEDDIPPHEDPPYDRDRRLPTPGW